MTAPFRASTRSAACRQELPAGRRSALILLVVLVMVVLLALLAASYTLMVRANLGTVMATQLRFQARLAAESGVQRAIVMLREARNDPAAWYDNPDQFRGWLVWGRKPDDVQIGKERVDTFDPSAPPAWRYNVVAPSAENPGTVRYGITDENARLHLNLATEEQLHRFFRFALPEETGNPVDVNVLVDSLLDWREPGDSPRPSGAKTSYYQSLRPAYRCKGAPFSTVEELLLVRGFTGWVLFGEDYNRNGLLDPNEDDGSATFPPDNGDGALFSGVAPMLTLWARESNHSRDGRPRIDLNMKDQQKLQADLEAEFRPDLVGYVLGVRAAGITFNSVMNLLPAPPPEEAPEDAPPDGESTSQPASTQPAASQPRPDGEGRFGGGSEGGFSDLGPSKSGKRPRSPVYKDLTATPPPGTMEDLPLILDRLTVQPGPPRPGRINVSTAPRAVLAALEALTERELDDLWTARAGLSPEERSTPAWLLTRQVLSENRFRQILDRITTGSSVFQVESVGYADHAGVVERVNVILEMRGPVPQVLYWRSLAGLGTAYQPHGDEQRGPRERAD
jgi:type II secretory pathway component PulK